MRKSLFKIKPVTKSIISLVAGAGVLAGAQLSVAAPSIEEVVVTARKKGSGEAVQDIPIAVTAVSGEMIDNRFFKDLTDLGNIAPNVQLSAVGSLPGTSNFFIRGMGVFGSIPSDESAVGIILDGVYLGVNSGALTNLFDVETVEILRGPQGTLFGRNVTGGAVVVQSRRPTEEFGGKVRARVGNMGQRSLDAAIGGGLSDQVLAKVALGYQTNDDYFDNTAGPDQGEGTSKYIRPIVTFKPSDDLDITLIGEYSEFDGDGVISKNSRLISSLDDHQVATDIDPQAAYEVKHLIADVDWDIGEGNLRVIAAWRDTFVEAELDGDGTPWSFFKVHSNAPWAVEQEQTSLEVRYFTPVTDNSEVTVGIYYFDQEISYAESRTLNTNGLGNPDVLVGAGAELDHTSYAIFGQGDIALTDVLTLTLGTRYTYEEKDAQVGSFGSCDAVGKNCNFDFEDDDDWSFISGYAGLKWQVNENAQSYASWTRSFRSGGYNLRNSQPNSPGPYNEEQLDAFEIGFKSDWLDQRMRFNAAIFHNTYSDLQRTVVTNSEESGVQQNKLNAADATMQGVELELTAFVTDNFRVDLSGGYIDAKYDKFENNDKSLTLPNVPETNGNITLTYNQAVGSGELEARASATYTDSQFADAANSPAIELDSYTVVDASIAYMFSGETMRVSLYGKNLTDKEYTNFGLGGLDTLWAIAPPRTYGVEFSYQF